MAQVASRNFLVYIIYDCILNAYSLPSDLLLPLTFPKCSALGLYYLVLLHYHYRGGGKIVVLVVSTAGKLVKH